MCLWKIPRCKRDCPIDRIQNYRHGSATRFCALCLWLSPGLRLRARTRSNATIHPDAFTSGVERVDEPIELALAGNGIIPHCLGSRIVAGVMAGIILLFDGVIPRPGKCESADHRSVTTGVVGWGRANAPVTLRNILGGSM